MDGSIAGACVGCGCDLTRCGSVRRRDPISSCRSRSIEVFPELRRRCVAHDLSSVRSLKCGTSLPKLISISVECELLSAFYRVSNEGELRAAVRNGSTN
jgi:hypothetical protein